MMKKAFLRLKSYLSWRDLKLSWKYGLAFIFMLMLFCIVTGFVTYYLDDVKERISNLDHSAERSAKIAQMGNLYEELIFITVSYMNNPRDQRIEQFEETHGELGELSKEVQTYMDTETMSNLFALAQDNSVELETLFF